MLIFMSGINEILTLADELKRYLTTVQFTFSTFYSFLFGVRERKREEDVRLCFCFDGEDMRVILRSGLY